MKQCSAQHCLCTTGLRQYGRTSNYYCDDHYGFCLGLKTEPASRPFLCLACLEQQSLYNLDTVFLELGEGRCSTCKQQDALYFYHLPSDSPPSAGVT